MKKLAYMVFAVLAVFSMAFSVHATTSGSDVEPILVPGAANKSCSQLAEEYGEDGEDWSEFKIDKSELNAGTTTITKGSLSVTVSNYNSYSFDWLSNFLVRGVYVKSGSKGSNLYLYDPESMSDTGLSVPADQGISHITFCYMPRLVVEKTAETSFTRTYPWTIEKTVTPDTWDLFSGDSGTSKYTILVTKGEAVDSDWEVEGTITVTNPYSMSVKITSITDTIEINGSESEDVVVDCGVSFPYTLGAGEMLECTYSSELESGADGINMTVVETEGMIAGGSATADIVFGEPTEVVNDSINVKDISDDIGEQNFGPTSTSTTFNYTRQFVCDEECGYEGLGNEVDNTATIVETGASSSASVIINCYELEVSKTADADFVETYPWTINKTVTPDTWDLFSGDSGTSKYTILVTKGEAVESGWSASGTISIHNPATVDAMLNSLTDYIEGIGYVTVDCGETSFPYTLEAGETLECTYTADLDDAYTRKNTATAVLQNYDYDYELNSTSIGTTTFIGEADIVFGDPREVVDEEITVEDNGRSWTFNSSSSTSYDATFVCGGECGYEGLGNEVDNTATIVETGASSSVSVIINCYELKVSKTAGSSFDRTYEWNIEKTSSTTQLTLEIGETAEVDYKVTVDADYTDSNRSASGAISIHNPATVGAMLNSLTDYIEGIGYVTVDCGGIVFPYTLGAGQTLSCTYQIDPLDVVEGKTNTATAVLQNHDYDFEVIPTPTGTTTFSGEATFGEDVMNEIDKCVDVDDDKYGSLGKVCYAETPKEFSYTLTVGPYDVCQTYDFQNTASFETEDTGVTESSFWIIEIDVPCEEGCTLTPGYWMTHSKYGPAPYDPTWELIGEDIIFFESGKTYYEVLHTPPAGNVYYQLAFHYIAAELNVLNETSIPDDVLEAWLGAKKLFEKYTPAQVAKWRGGQGERREFIRLADILADYNEGITGPGHCDWEYDMDAYSAEASDTEYDDTMLMSISLSVEGDNLENSTEENTSEELEETGTDNMTEEEPIQNSGDPDIDTSSSSDEKEATDEGELVEAVTEGATEGVLDESADLTEEDSKDTSSDDSQSVAVTDEGEAESTEASVEESPEEKVEEKEERAPGPPAGRGNPKNR